MTSGNRRNSLRCSRLAAGIGEAVPGLPKGNRSVQLRKRSWSLSTETDAGDCNCWKQRFRLRPASKSRTISVQTGVVTRLASRWVHRCKSAGCDDWSRLIWSGVGFGSRQTRESNFRVRETEFRDRIVSQVLGDRAATKVAARSRGGSPAEIRAA